MLLPIVNRQRAGRLALAAGGLLVSATALAFGIGSVLDKPATFMSPADYAASKAAIEGETSAELDRCLILEGTALGVCLAEVQAEERLLRAKLEARYLGTVEATESLRRVKADGAYNVSVAHCDGREGKARFECLKDARQERAKALASASS